MLERPQLAWLLGLLLAHTVVAEEATTPCQSPGWDMAREAAAFANPGTSGVAGVAPARTPVLRIGKLYVLDLRPQGEVHFLQPTAKTGGAPETFGGLAQFTVPSSGIYRITVDLPLWIDVALPDGAIAPTAFTGWHDCTIYRKSVDFLLEAGKPFMLQLSGAKAGRAKLTIEAPRQPPGSARRND